MLMFYLQDAGTELKLYASPINFRPDAPPIPLSAPREPRRRSLQAPGPVSHARLGGGDQPAARGAHRREDVHGRSVPRVRRSRERDPRPARRHQLGSFVGVIESHRPRAAHDVRPDSGTSGLRSRNSPGSSATESSASTAARISSSVRSSTSCRRARDPDRLDHGFHAWRKAVDLNTWLVEAGLTWSCRARRGQEARRPVRRRRVLRERRLVEDQGLQHGPRPGLLQPSRARGPGHRKPGAESTALAEELKVNSSRHWSTLTRSKSPATSTSATTRTRASTSATRPTCSSASRTVTASRGRPRSAARRGNRLPDQEMERRPLRFSTTRRLPVLHAEAEQQAITTLSKTSELTN